MISESARRVGLVAGRVLREYAGRAVATRKLKLQGREVVGEDIEFRIINDGAVTIEADDGARLRLKPIIINVVRTNERSPEGERLYVVQCLNQVIVVEPGKEDQT